MSLLDNLKESGKSFFEKTSERIRESSTFVQLQDRYESLTPSGQKIAAAGAVFLALFFLLFIPMSNLFNSHTTLVMFEEKRTLIRDLFRTYRESSSSAHNVAMPPPLESLKMNIQSILARAELAPEQNQGVTDGSVEGVLLPQSLISNVVFVNLAKLNLKQVVDIGASLLAISDSIKMKDINIIANEQDARYYDVTYKLYTLKVPEPTPEPMPEPEPTKKSARGRDSGNSDDKKEADE